MLNRIVILGRLTRDPEVKTTAGGITAATFTLAVARPFKSNATGERETDFIPVVVWRNQAEICGKYLRKGELAAVDGRLQIRAYEAKDGSKRVAAEVVADNVRFFLTPRGGEEGDSGSAYGSTPQDYGSMGPETLPPDNCSF